MDFQYYLNEERLSNHTLLLKEGKYIAQRLRDNIEYVKRLSEDSYAGRFQDFIRKADNMAHFFDSLASVLENTSAEAAVTVHKIGNMIDDSGYDINALIQIDSEKYI